MQVQFARWCYSCPLSVSQLKQVAPDFIPHQGCIPTCRQFNSSSESTESCSPYTRVCTTAAAYPSPLQAAAMRRRGCRAEPGSRGCTQAGARVASAHHQSAHAGGWRLWRCKRGTGTTAGRSNAQVETILPIVTAKLAFHPNMTGRHHSGRGHPHAICLPVGVLEVQCVGSAEYRNAQVLTVAAFAAVCSHARKSTCLGTYSVV